MGHANYSYNAANQLVTPPCSSSGQGGTCFDANGNQTVNGENTTAAYNAKNQTSTITPPPTPGLLGPTTTPQNMTYAGAGQAERVFEGATTAFVSNDLGLGIEYDQVNAPAGVLVGDQPTYFTRDSHGDLTEERTPSGNFYYVFDGLGSVVALTDANGNVVNTYKYDPYGRTVSKTGTTANPWQFAGQYHDVTGFYKMGERYYDASNGRWLQQDAVVAPFDPHQSNRYIYVGDDPANFVDSNGQDASPSLGEGTRKAVSDCVKAGAVGTVVGAVSSISTGPALPVAAATGFAGACATTALCNAIGAVDKGFGQFCDVFNAARGIRDRLRFG